MRVTEGLYSDLHLRTHKSNLEVTVRLMDRIIQGGFFHSIRNQHSKKAFGNGLETLREVPLARLAVLDNFHHQAFRQKNRVKEPCGLRTYWQKFANLIPRNIRTCLAKLDQADSYVWVTVL